MRLISLKIENFGNLSEYTLSFERDLTVIFEDNGFGKTTLAEFIKTMFYGFREPPNPLRRIVERKISLGRAARMEGISSLSMMEYVIG